MARDRVYELSSYSARSAGDNKAFESGRVTEEKKGNWGNFAATFSWNWKSVSLLKFIVRCF